MARFGFQTVSLVLSLVSFVFLLLATISTPVVTSFALSTTSTHSYGIFGYCYSSENQCTKATYPYTFTEANDDTDDWTLSSNTRDKLAGVFIVAPIALGLNFITFAIIFGSHFTSKPLILPAVALNIIAFIATTLVAVIVVLVFNPHVNWTGWILIGSAAATLISLILLFVSLKFNDDSSNDDIDSNISLDKYVVNEDYEKPTTTNGFSSNFGGPVPLNVPAPNKFNSYDTSSSISKDFDSSTSNPYIRSQVTTNPLPQPPSQQTGFVVTPHQPRNTYGAPNSNPSNPNQQRFQDENYIIPKSSNSSIYNSAAQTANDFTAHNRNYQPSTSSYYDGATIKTPVEPKINIVDTLHTPISVKQQMAPNLIANIATPGNSRAAPNLTYPSNHIRDSTAEPVYPINHSSVFEHHPEVEGHKPFTELDDFDLADYADDDENAPLNKNNDRSQGHHEVGNESDADSDFTSVSQRAVNPKYGAPAPPPHQNYFPVPQNPLPHQNSYNHVQQFQPGYQQNQNFYSSQPPPQQHYQGPPPQNTSYGGYQPHPQQHQPARSSISDNVLANNPDFGVRGGPVPAKRRVQPGFVPVANRMNNTNNKAAAASSLMGRGPARSGPYGVI